MLPLNLFFSDIFLSLFSNLNLMGLNHVILMILNYALRSYGPWRDANTILLQSNYAVFLCALKSRRDHFSNTWLFARSTLPRGQILLVLFFTELHFSLVEVLLADFVIAKMLLKGHSILNIEPKEFTVELWAVKSRHVRHAGMLK